jgi:hypothetical protein
VRKDEARALITEILTTAAGPMTSRQVFNADARLADYKQVTNVLSDLRADGLVTRRNGGYVLGAGSPEDPEYGEVSRVHPALALLGRQDLGEYGIEDLDVKLGVLRRLEQLMEPSIGKTLRLIREDLERLAVTEEG